MSSDDAQRSPPQMVCVIRLPSDKHILYCWKVRSGSSVRLGETVALAKLKNDLAGSKEGTDSPTTTTPSTPTLGVNSAPTAKVHKRPTRRRKLGAAITTNDSTHKSLKPPPPGNKSAATASAQTDLIAILAQGDGIVQMGLPPSNGFQPMGKITDDSLVIGHIDRCRHPTIIGELCAVCGRTVPTEGRLLHAKQQDDDNDNNSHHKPAAVKMTHVTVSGTTVAITEGEGRRMAQQDAERLRQQKKLSLVLDLDHTLVHATSDIRANQHLQRSDVRNLVLPLLLEQRGHNSAFTRVQQVWMHHFVKLRPFVKEFLETASELFEVGVYTAGTRDYAEQITIMLSRHMVGATCDEVDVDGLRRRVAMASEELERLKPKSQRVREAAASEKDEDKKPAAQTTNGKDEKGVAGVKRKRVTFSDATASQLTDHIIHCQKEVTDLRSRLEEAERLEALALAMRQRLFGSRVVSRTDVADLGRDVKSLSRIFPCGGTMAVVVDDREDVWANAGDTTSSPRKGEPPENLLLVRPYHWRPFLGYADVNNNAGKDLSATGANSMIEDASAEDAETDEQLLWTRDILKRLHRRFYSPEQPSNTTVAEVLRRMRRQVLSGAKIVLSGLVPLHKRNLGPDFPRPPVVRYVESLGAVVLPTVTSSTTHVVGAKDGTDKTLKGRLVPGCSVVKPSWLMECLWTLTRRDESKHLLGRARQDGTQVQPLGSSHVENKSSSSSSSEDDDLAAEFENDFAEDS